MQLNIPGLVGAGYLPAITTYKKLEKDGGEDAQLVKVAKDKTIQANMKYVEGAIAKAKKPDDLFNDRKVMQFILSAFSLDTELDKSMGIIKKVLSEDPTKKTALANRLADPRYAQMAKSLDFFHNGLTKLKADSTDSATYDMSLTGNNYFVMADTVKGDTVYRYAQSASFTEDSKGYLAGPNGLPVQAWSLDTKGERPAALDQFNNYSSGKLVPVNLDVFDNKQSPTTSISVDTNLKSTVDASTAGPHYIETVKVYDTSGTERSVELQYTKQDTTDGTNKWNLKVLYAGSPDEPLNGTAGTDLIFNANGSLQDTDTAIAGNQNKLELDNVHFFGNFGDSNISIDLSQLRSTTTGSYSIAAKTDSVKLGKHNKIDIDKNGIVSATYEGGQKLKLYQLATSSFNAPGGLVKGTDTKKDLLSTSAGSGSAIIKVPGLTGGSIDTSSKASTADTLMASLKKSYYRNEYETAIGNEKGALREALYFKRNASSATTIYNILGDKVLRDVVAKAFNIPDQVASQQVTTQAAVFERHIDIKKLSDPKFVDKIINTYLSQVDAASSGSSGSSSWQANLLSGNTSIDFSLTGKNYSTLI